MVLRVGLVVKFAAKLQARNDLERNKCYSEKQKSVNQVSNCSEQVRSVLACSKRSHLFSFSIVNHVHGALTNRYFSVSFAIYCTGFFCPFANEISFCNGIGISVMLISLP